MKIGLLAFLLFGAQAFAGNRVGNGGDILECAKKIQLLDFYEGKIDGSPKLKTDQDAQKILNERLDLLAKVAPKLAAQYRRRSVSILSDRELKDDVALMDVEDSLHSYLPKDKSCKLKQIAIRQEVPSGEKQFIFDAELWRKLDAKNKAGLVLHEVIYEHFLKLGEEDSRKTRKLNAYIFSDSLSKTSSGKFWLMIKDLGLPLYP